MAKRKKTGIGLEHLVNQEPVDDAMLFDESINIGYLALYLENEAGLGVTKEDYKLLDKILATAKARITVKKKYRIDEPFQILDTVADILDEFGFKYKSDKNNRSLLNKSLKTKKIDCDETTLLYLAIAEHIGLPLRGVTVMGNSREGHAFIRWLDCRIGDGNWDCTDRTEPINHYLIKLYNVHPDAIKNGSELKTLDRKEYIATLLVNCADSDFRVSVKSLANYDRAIELNPRDSRAYINRGRAKAQKDDLDGAISDFDMAIELNPVSSHAYYDRGKAGYLRHDYSGAIKNYERCIELYPDHPERVTIDISLRVARRKLAKRDEAKRDSETYERLTKGKQ